MMKNCAEITHLCNFTSTDDNSNKSKNILNINSLIYEPACLAILINSHQVSINSLHSVVCKPNRKGTSTPVIKKDWEL
jgi:hypothetical protein